MFPGAVVYGMAPESALLAGLALPRSPISHVMRPKDTGVRLSRPLNDGDRML